MACAPDADISSLCGKTREWRTGPGFSPRLDDHGCCRKGGALQAAEKPFQAVILSAFAVILSEAKNLALPAQGKLREESRSAHFHGNTRFFAASGSSE